MDALQKLMFKREAIRRLTKNLFQKIDEELWNENSIELEVCLEKLNDKESSLKELNMRVEFFCTDKDVFDEEIGCSEVWNENVIDYRTKINQKLKILSSNNTLTQTFPVPIVTSLKTEYPSNNFEFDSCIDEKLQENPENQGIGSLEDESANSKTSLVKQPIALEECRNETNRAKRTRICKDCNITVAHFIKHRSLVHNDPKPYKCTSCSFASNIEANLKAHFAVHTGEKPHQCIICKKKFRFASALSRHSQVHLNKTLYKCNLCPKRFIRKRTLLNHTERTHKGKKLPDNNSVASEKLSTEKNGSNNKNKQQNKKSNSKKNPKKNLETFNRSTCITQTTGTFVDCVGIRSDENSSVKEGFTTGNKDKSRKKSFIHKYQLNYHERVHTSKNSFECKFCEKRFIYQSNLIKHEKIHTTKYQCGVCFKYFKNNGALGSHSRAHNKEKPYQCKVCLKPFSNVRAMISHSLVHSREQPYQCKMCMKYFTHKGAMTNHSRVHRTNKSNIPRSKLTCENSKVL